MRLSLRHGLPTVVLTNDMSFYSYVRQDCVEMTKALYPHVFDMLNSRFDGYFRNHTIACELKV